jgi:hypothetical protein
MRILTSIPVERFQQMSESGGLPTGFAMAAGMTRGRRVFRFARLVRLMGFLPVGPVGSVLSGMV